MDKCENYYIYTSKYNPSKMFINIEYLMRYPFAESSNFKDKNKAFGLFLETQF